ncbi:MULTISPECIES: helix-turn-helix transcriptional regulator [Streptomyces]|uniref:Helix-turn-helix transcriptional regulator n=1 Tax=Streptomyces spirodelae TaxID=2812904 RepID=A0ABS3WUF4_9ACTN|nr:MULTISPECIES: helix-turn-helix transcriptional regulator [Streptomyces]MBO8186731.1 helix-turn-helix transcriptional regulator [Streptomyces spirodelae]UNZ17724.1 helix-turn-helix transcriptional regulator [Streptomyces sp. 891-h]
MSEHVHNRLAVVRAERKVSRQALAEAVGAHYQTIGYIERGQYNPSLDLALRIAAYFRLPVEALFSLEPFRPLTDEVYGTGGAGTARTTGRTTT